MKLIKWTLIAMEVAIFIGICLIMLFDNVITLFTSLLVIFLVGTLVSINYALAGFDKLQEELDRKV